MSQVIDNKLFAAIDKLSEHQKEEVLIFVAGILDPSEQYNKWEDETFVKEMDSRYEHYKNGGKMITAEEADKRIKDLFKAK